MQNRLILGPETVAPWLDEVRHRFDVARARKGGA